jgi:hypothetical protein
MIPSLARVALSAIVLLAAAFRFPALATYRFSDDEAAKLRAIDGYRHGDLTVNAEHPMLMKLAMWGSVNASERWNALFPARSIAAEAALRAPNALAVVVFRITT